MQDRELDDIVAVLPPLLQAMETLNVVARRPEAAAQAVAAFGRPQEALVEALPRLEAWPDTLDGVRQALTGASAEALAGLEALDVAALEDGDPRRVYRALRHAPRAQEALYPLAKGLAPVSRFFLPTELRGDEALAARLAEAPDRDDVGVAHVEGEAGPRGGFSIYVPETYSPEAPMPLVMALHGGAGNGRGFLWSWLREARGLGAILIAPTAIGETWALQGPDVDTPNLKRILERVGRNWTIDPDRLLLTGMSDGGTFSYVSGLEGGPFTHLAPASAAFHPMLAQMADPERLAGLPIFISHGARDWMFPVDMAREAAAALEAAGADVTYREIEDLSHAYPRELNVEILAWMNAD